MTLAYFDCFAGAGGDMIVGSLLDAGADLNALKRELSKLDLGGYTIDTEAVTRGGLVGTMFSVHVEGGEQPSRHLSDILAIIDRADLPPRVTDRGRRIFTRLGETESKVHGVTLEQVHFHEVGAIDSIVDIVGACIALELLSVERVICSAIPVGRGMVTSAHGQLPVPSPATAQLLIGAPMVQTERSEELTTPTAAAVLTTLAESYGETPAMELSAVGYGAGKRDSEDLPNLLRVLVGEPTEFGAVDTVVELSANIDDCPPELLGATIEKLFAAGCLDTWAAPIYMKKSRPAWMLCALCSPSNAETAQTIIFHETTTFGIRKRICGRTKLTREYETVETPYGPIRIKVGILEGKVVTASPEFEDCLAAAETHAVAVREVMTSAQGAYKKETQG